MNCKITPTVPYGKVKSSTVNSRSTFVLRYLVRPDGLPVRCLRTESPNTTDWARAFDVAIANKRCAGFKKTTHSKMSLTFSYHRPQTPMYKGLRAREGKRFSLTSPSLFSLRALTSCSQVSECDPKCEGNVRDNRSSLTSINALYIRVWR